MKRIVVLVSGEGRNLQALIDHCEAGHIRARIAAVVSNKPGVRALARAEAAGVATAVVPHGAYASREAFDAALAAAIEPHAPEVLALAGFMRILTPGFTQRFEGRALNIHPSLLPRHKGLHTHAAALAAGDAEHGASVHFVSSALDGGPVVIQGGFTVAPNSAVEQLAEQVMNRIELKIFPQAVAWCIDGRLALAGGQAWFEGRPLTTPLTLDHLEAPFR